MLHSGLKTSSSTTIKRLWLSYNDLTQSSSSTIRDLTIHCGIEYLWIDNNYTVGEDHTLFSILSHPRSRLTLLSIMQTGLSSMAAITLFTELAKGNKLQQLSVTFDDSTDELFNVIGAKMKENTSLVRLVMNTDDVKVYDAQQIVEAFQLNNTLQEVHLNWWSYPKDVKEKIILLQDEVNKKRETRGCQVKLSVKFLN